MDTGVVEYGGLGLGFNSVLLRMRHSPCATQPPTFVYGGPQNTYLVGAQIAHGTKKTLPDHNLSIKQYKSHA